MAEWRLHRLYSSLWANLAAVTFGGAAKVKAPGVLFLSFHGPNQRCYFPEHHVKAGLRNQPLESPPALLFVLSPPLNNLNANFHSFRAKDFLSSDKVIATFLTQKIGEIPLFGRQWTNSKNQTRGSFFHQKILPCVHSSASYIIALLLPS